MKLRARLALTLFALIVPFGLALGFVQARFERAALEERIYARTLAFMDAGGRERCERAPERFRGEASHRRRGRHRRADAPRDRLFTYDASLTPAQARAPKPPAALAEALEAGADIALDMEGRGPRVWALLAMPWDEGPCARVLVATRRPPATALWPSLVVAALVALIALIAVGPLVRRIRRLTASVERSATSPNAPIALRGADELAELARAFERSRAQIHEQLGEITRREQALRDYIANTTHDLMLPLSVLQGSLTSLERQLGAEAAARATLHAALEESHYLASMVQNLAAAARLEAGVPETSMSEVDLSALVERVVGRHRRIAEQRGIELAFAVPEEPPRMRADLTLLEQALSNLVHNAVRYGHEGGHVAVVLELEPEGRLRLRVLDDGPGIPEAHLARITERGYRGDAARTRGTLAGGLGLGLYIVSDVAERHGLCLRLEPGPEGGLVAELSGQLERA